MGMSIDQSYDEIKKHILTSDLTYRVWEFGKPSNLGPDFQSGDFTVSVIDPFGGKIPRLISYETIMGQLPPPLVPTVILDSNVMSLLHSFVMQREMLLINKRTVATHLIDYFVRTGVDYNPVFYSFEAFWKNQNSDFSERYMEFSKSILSLHMMDERHFIKKREIRPDRKSFKKYCEKFGTEDLDEMARWDYEYTKTATADHDDLNVFYITLIKMALIHKTSNKSIISKEELKFFCNGGNP